MGEMKGLDAFVYARMKPVADICEYSFTCTYEEDLQQLEVNERWFEAPDGTTLFSIVRTPIAVTEYLNQAQLDAPKRYAEGDPELEGKGVNRPVPELSVLTYLNVERAQIERGGEAMDGGQHLYDDIMGNIHDPRGGEDAFIGIGANGESRSELTMECAKACFPRAVSLSVIYWQYSNYQKDLLGAEMGLDEWDKDFEKRDYEFSFSMVPLSWIGLIIAFAFSIDIFIVLFAVLGVLSIILSGAFYLNIRQSTRLETPPKFRMSSYLFLIMPPAISGVFIGSFPIFMVLWMWYIIIYGEVMLGIGDSVMMPSPIFEGETHYLMDNWPNHWKEKKLDPSTQEVTRHGRFGLAMLCVGMFCIVLSAKIFLPKRVSKREKGIEMKRDKQAQKETVWVPTLWKRSNFIFASVMMGLFSTILIELSFWSDFGDNVWYLIILFRPAGIILDLVIEGQLGESLLAAPLVATFSLCTDIVTLGSDNFLDFILCFIVEFGMLLFERCFWDPGFGMFFEVATEKMAELIAFIKKKMKLKGKSKIEEQAAREKV